MDEVDLASLDTSEDPVDVVCLRRKGRYFFRALNKKMCTHGVPVEATKTCTHSVVENKNIEWLVAIWWTL